MLFFKSETLFLGEMPRESSSLQAIKEELEEMIDQVKNEVDKTDKDISQIKRRQDESFDLLCFKMEKLKEDFKSLS